MRSLTNGARRLLLVTGPLNYVMRCPYDANSNRVAATWAHTDPATTYLTIDSDRILATPAHPFATRERGWVPAGLLTVGEHIRKANGGWGVVRAVRSEWDAGVRYNLTVETAHTYAVGDGGWVAHNSCVIHGSKRQARSAAFTESGIGRNGARTTETLPLKPGSQAPTGPPGMRTEVTNVSNGHKVHHDPYGTRYDDGEIIGPHFGVDYPDGRTTHHTWPSPHNPRRNR